LPTTKSLKITAIVLSKVLAVVLIVQNTESVETKFSFLSFAMPGAVLLLVGVAVGMIVASRIYRKREGTTRLGVEGKTPG
jgi:uncharacterized integral membrane protein